MNKYLLMISVAIMTLGIASESWATCPNGTLGSDDASNSDYCGVKCCWVITTVTNNDKTEKVLTITPALDSNNKPYTGVKMANFNATSPGIANGYTSTSSSNAPWARQGVTSVVVENGISNIGNNAFCGDTKITSVSGMENVATIGEGAFHFATSLKSVTMPNVTSIRDFAFKNAESLKSVDMPNVTSLGFWAFAWAFSLSYAGLNPNGSVSIGGAAFGSTKIPSCNGRGANCGSCGNKYIMRGLGCVADCGAGYLEKEGRCIDAANGCGENYKDMGGWCNRVRWTPAEVAKVLHDDNTNVVTITFKHQ